MTESQQQIINLISAEIASALGTASSERAGSSHSPDEQDWLIKRMLDKAAKLRAIREGLENEFTTFNHPGF